MRRGLALGETRVEGPQFFKAEGSLSVAEIIALTGAEPRTGAALDRRILDVAPIDAAGPDDLTFIDNARFVGALASTKAGAVLTTARFEARAPSALTVLRVR
jgi:UDP-3-O-[3-hydroxymyristoyl] glucosamine N-acyltransferase